MTTIRKPASWGFWLLWVVASMVGFTVAATALPGMLKVIPETTPALLRGLLFCGTAAVGASLPGFLHCLILRRRFSHAAWWIPASGAGSILGFVVLGWGLAVADTGQGVVNVTIVPNLASAGAGAVVGAMQWLVLRRWVSRAGWWILLSSISWIGATFVYSSLTRGNDVNLPLGGAASGSLSGAITGLVLVWLLRKASADEPLAARTGALRV